jgi:hypothetical protein
MTRLTTLLLALFMTLPAWGATPLQANSVNVTGDPATKVVVVPRTTNTTPNITVIVNKQDTVMLNGAQFYPVPVPVHMHGGVQGILHTHPIIASADGLGFQAGTDQVMLSTDGALGAPGAETDWEAAGAIRTVCKSSHMSNDDAIVYPGQPGMAHDHTFFRPGTDAFLTNANVRAAGSKSTCRGGTLDETARWVPTMFDTVSMQAVIPHALLMYYKTGNCNYSIPCSGRSDATAAPLLNIHWVPQGLHIIAGDPSATAPTGVVQYTCMVNSTGNGRVGASNSNTIPTCMQDGTESLWEIIHLPACLAVNPDGTPVLDSPDHKSHAADYEGWPAYNSPWPGKAYRCPADHPYAIPQIAFNVIYDILPNTPGMDTSKWNLSCGSAYCGHADWFDGWDQTIMVPTSVECLQKRRNCGTFQIFDGRTALEFQGN